MTRALLLLLLGGCYASHEASCSSDLDCSSESYCERRLACELEPDGSVTCDPRRLCTLVDGRFDLCDGDGSGWLGLCVPPSSRELWR